MLAYSFFFLCAGGILVFFHGWVFLRLPACASHCSKRSSLGKPGREAGLSVCFMMPIALGVELPWLRMGADHLQAVLKLPPV